MELACFGIEFETCVCDTSSQEQPITLDGYTDELQRLSGEATTVFNHSYDPSVVNYNVWTVTVDYSVHCETEDSVLKAKLEKEKYEHCKFTSIELVSPKTSYSKEGYSKFVNTLENVVLDKRFVYDVNRSQGMHINVSHPDQDKLKTLLAWWYFEPVLLSFVPANRRISRFAVALREHFSTVTKLEAEWEDFYEECEEPPAKYTTLCVKPNRFEFRLVPASMQSDHILAWLGLCVRFVFASIVKPRDFDFDSTPTADMLFDFLSFDGGVDTVQLKRYFTESEPYLSTSRILNIVQERHDDQLRALASADPTKTLTRLIELVPIIQNLSLLQCISIVISENSDRIDFPRYIEFPEYVADTISNIFERSNVSLERLDINASNYKNFIVFENHAISVKIIEVATVLRDCETINSLCQNESNDIAWIDIFGIGNRHTECWDFLIDCVNFESAPSDIPEEVGWHNVVKLWEKYPTMTLISFPASWVQPAIAERQMSLLAPYSNSSGFMTFVIDNASNTEIVIKMVQPIINHLQDDRKFRFINLVFLQNNSLANAYISIYLIDEDFAFDCVRALGTDPTVNISSELLLRCSSALPDRRIKDFLDGRVYRAEVVAFFTMRRYHGI